MLLKADKFPLTDLTEQEFGFVSDFLGHPRPDQDILHAFIELGGRPLVDSNLDLLNYMIAMRHNLLSHMGQRTTGPARWAFTATSLVYAGVYQYVTRANSLPLEANALARAGDIQPEDFMLDHDERFEKYPNFRGLLDVVLPELGITGPNLTKVGLAGAGAMHVGMLEAAEPVRATPEETYVSLEELFELPSANGIPDAFDFDADLRRHFTE